MVIAEVFFVSHKADELRQSLVLSLSPSHDYGAIVALWVYAQRNTKCLFGCLYLIDLYFTLCTYLIYVTRNEKSSTMFPVYNVITALHR